MALAAWMPRIFSVIALCAIGAAVATVVAGSSAEHDERNCADGFDQQRWLATAKAQDGARLSLFNELVACQVLIGKTDTDVRALLGSPRAHGGRQWAYYLAECGIDTCQGYVNFGRDGRVTRAQAGEG